MFENFLALLSYIWLFSSKFLLYAIKVQIFIFYGKVSRTRTSIGGKKGWVFLFVFLKGKLCELQNQRFGQRGGVHTELIKRPGHQ